jgi:hypothetical protein
VTVDFPPFIPLSLKTLTLKVVPSCRLEPLLCGVASMLQTSNVTLDAFKIELRGNASYPTFHSSTEGGAALAQVLHACSSTLKTLQLPGWGFCDAYVFELRPCLISCCDTLEVLHCHGGLFTALPATCPIFPRLTELRLERGADDKGFYLVQQQWDVMINGRLPALTSLSLPYIYGYFSGKGESAREGCRQLTRAFEAVAGTLRRLTLTGGCSQDNGGMLRSARQRLGAAIGKLRRLRYLKLDLFTDAWDHHAMGEGLASSGGCPELLRLELHGIRENIVRITGEPSLIVPSVRDLSISGRCTKEEALMLCCALVQGGYKHRLLLDLRDPDDFRFACLDFGLYEGHSVRRWSQC